MLFTLYYVCRSRRRRSSLGHCLLESSSNTVSTLQMSKSFRWIFHKQNHTSQRPGSPYTFCYNGTNVVDPDPLGSALIRLFWIWIRIKEHENWQKWTNKPDFQPFKTAFSYVGVIVTYYLRKVYFSRENWTFCDGKFWPGFGSAFWPCRSTTLNYATVDFFNQKMIFSLLLFFLQEAGFYTVESVVYAPRKKLTDIKESRQIRLVSFNFLYGVM